MAAVSSIMTAIGVGGLVTGAVGTGVQMVGQRKASKASERAENLREQQMQLDYQRRQRETIRRQMVANAMAVARGTSQGVNLESSAIPGAIAEQAGTAGRDMLYNTQSADIGVGLFNANADIAAGQSLAATGQGIGKLGSSLVSNSQMIGQIGNSLFDSTGGWQTSTRIG